MIALREVRENYKKMEFQGVLTNVASRTGQIETEEKRPGNVYWRVWHTEPIKPGKKGTLDWSYSLMDEFEAVKEWTYSIDAPTSQFRSAWIFAQELAPKDNTLRIDHMRTLSKIETYSLIGMESEVGVAFSFQMDLPPYRDWFRFYWN